MNKSDLKIIMKIVGAQIGLHDAIVKVCRKTECDEAYEILQDSFKNIEDALNMIDKEASNNV